MFWTTEKIRKTQSGQILIDPFNSDFVKNGAYELSLGAEAFITTERNDTKQSLDPGEQLTIPPGQFGLLLTEEVVNIPNNAIGFISVRFKKKRQGLVNVSGFHVDPGFKGRLKFAVYNAGSQKIVLSRGERIFMIWFSDLSEATSDTYKGERSGLMEITSEDVMALQGEIASPAELKEQIEEMRRDYEKGISTLEDKMGERFSGVNDKIATWRGITIAVLTVLGFGILIVVLRESLHSPAIPPNPTVESNRPSGTVQNPNENRVTASEANANSSEKSTPTPQLKPSPTE
jgi:dCTP deaminase